MTKYDIIIFLVLSIPVIFFSKHVLLNLKAHGFYRFISWECIAWLTARNYKYWFDDIFSFHQIISWLILFCSMYLIIAGVVLIKKIGKAKESRKDDALYNFEKTTELIEIGLYKYIRHPLYGSLLFLTWGIFFKNFSIELLIISFISSIFLFLTAKVEEKENINFFGDKYNEYMKRTKMFIPYLF